MELLTQKLREGAVRRGFREWGTTIHRFLPSSSAVDGSCGMCCCQGGMGVARSNKLIHLMKPRADSVLSGLCTTLPSLWFGCDPLSISHASAIRHGCAMLMGFCFVSGAELNEGGGLRKVRVFWFSLFMAGDGHACCAWEKDCSQKSSPASWQLVFWHQTHTKAQAMSPTERFSGPCSFVGTHCSKTEVTRFPVSLAPA